NNNKIPLTLLYNNDKSLKYKSFFFYKKIKKNKIHFNIFYKIKNIKKGDSLCFIKNDFFKRYIIINFFLLKKIL
ncbi:hypothetical protein, partial [Candidatus Shikimatogenerans silvanidophilus]|uniref:hypothetical protein n=1 Tax=Candidatus Shikimatogenerans silvanidophilus TaxID=2782547 RepID=UPI001BAC5CD9